MTDGSTHYTVLGGIIAIIGGTDMFRILKRGDIVVHQINEPPNFLRHGVRINVVPLIISEIILKKSLGRDFRQVSFMTGEDSRSIVDAFIMYSKEINAQIDSSKLAAELVIDCGFVKRYRLIYKD